MTLNDIEVKKVEAIKLPTPVLFSLRYRYHADLSKYVTAFDERKQILYVNPEVPEEDMQKFVAIASYPEIGINDFDCPIADAVDYVCDTYGWDTYRILLDAHTDRSNKLIDVQAKEQAEKIVPLIKKVMDQIVDDEVADPFNEPLVYQISNAGSKEKYRTARNLVGLSTKYVFFLGYLMGTGQIKL